MPALDPNYPAWVYRCRRAENGTISEEGIICEHEADWPDLERAGWVAGGPVQARERLEMLERMVGDATAEAAFVAQKKMSRKARAEYEAREAATDQHVTE